MINTIKRNSSLKCSLLAVALGCGLSASAQTMTTSTNFPVGQVVPDDAPSGLASSKMVSTPIAYISKVRVNLKLSGTWNGDMYCYLAHSSGRTVLLNRVGRRPASSLGYGDEGFDVTFDDAANDIHTYRLQVTGNQFTPITGVLTNVWAPDARTNSPYSVLEGDARSAFLSSFNGLNPNGEWILFVADVESGDIFTLDNWGLEITGYTPPSIASAPIDATAECTSGSATFTVSAVGSSPLNYNWRFNGASISGATSSSLTIDHPTFASSGSYDVVITNSYGSLTSSVASLTVQDTTPPSITCPATLTVATDPGQCFASGVNLGSPIASDSCGSVSLANNAPLHFPVGPTVVTWTATDDHGNVNACDQTVIVNDTQAPTVGAPANIAVNNDAGQCTASVTFAATPSDNCGVASTVYKIGATTITSPHVFPVGSTTVDVVVTDIHGNSANGSFTVAVSDNEAPTVNAPANIAVNNDAGQCTASVTFAATPSDNCGVASTVYKIGGSAITSPHTFPVGSTTVDVLVTDIHGNSANGSFMVTVSDNEAPIVNVPANIAVNNDAGQCTASVTFAATPSDNCGVASTVYKIGGSAITSPHTFPAGSTTVDVVVTDIHGNSANGSFTVTVSDNELPVITLVGAASMTNECHTSFTDPGATANDNCAGSLSVVTSGSVNPNAVGSYTLTYTATDPSGNVGTASRTVYVVDTTAPSVVIPGNITVYTTNASGSAVSYTVSASDACAGPITPVCTPASGTTCPIGTSTVAVSATDGNGNTSNCTFTVTVILNHAPVAHDSTLGAVENHSRSLLIEKLLAKATDADGDALTVSAVSATSTNGGTVTLSDTAIIYTPAANFVGTDLFTYTVSDGKGGLGIGSIIVQVTSENDPSLNRIGSLTVTQSGVTISFAGIPGYSYTVERAASPVGPWGAIGTFTVPDNGIASYTDTHPLQGQGYYRTASQ